MSTNPNNELQDFFAELSEVIATKINPEDPHSIQLDEDEELLDQGLDSIRLVEITDFIRERGYLVDFVDLAGDTRLSSWRELLSDAS